MSAGRYLLGWLELGAMVAPPAWAAVRLRARTCRHFSGALARLAELTIVLAFLVVASELLGTLHALRALPLVILCAISGILAGALTKPRRVRPSSRRAPRLAPSVGAAAIVLALVVFEQLSTTLLALHGGISEFDSLTYHLPTAARWLQTASLTEVHQIYPGSLYAYYPFNAELLHALGMIAFGRDLISPLLGLGFVALVLLSAWCVGAARGAPLLAMAAVAAILTTAEFSKLGGGTALNDLAGVGFVLTAVALVAGSRYATPELFVAALAAGLALGTKPPNLEVVAFIAAGAVAAIPARRRRGVAVVWIGGILLGGGYWYLRDVVWVGTPLPGLHAGPLPSPTAFPWPLTFFDGVRKGIDTLTVAANGFDAALGPLWPVYLVLAAVGLVLSLGPSRAAWQRAAGLGGIVNIALWPFSPFTENVFFSVRYMAPALMLGAVLTVTAPVVRNERRPVLLWLLVAVSVFTVGELRPQSFPYRGAALAGALLTVLAALVATRLPRRMASVAAVLATLAAATIGLPLSRHYLSGRYALASFRYVGAADAEAVKILFAWARGLHHQRIAVEGGELQYPLYGAELSNYVQYLGRTDRSGGFVRIASCAGWRRAIDDGRFRYVVTVPWGSESNSPPLPSPQAEWTASDPSARLVLRPGSGISVFTINRPMHPSSCAG